MGHTINSARSAGMIAAMDSGARREPPEFSGKRDPRELRNAWLEGFDSLSTAMMNQRPGVMEAPAKAKQTVEDVELVEAEEPTVPKKPRKALTKKQTAESVEKKPKEQVPAEPKMMMQILDEAILRQ